MMTMITHLEKYASAYNQVIGILKAEIYNDFCLSKCSLRGERNCVFLNALAQTITDYFDTNGYLDNIYDNDSIITKCVNEFNCLFNAERLVSDGRG